MEILLIAAQQLESQLNNDLGAAKDGSQDTTAEPDERVRNCDTLRDSSNATSISTPVAEPPVYQPGSLSRKRTKTSTSLDTDLKKAKEKWMAACRLQQVKNYPKIMSFHKMLKEAYGHLKKHKYLPFKQGNELCRWWGRLESKSADGLSTSDDMRKIYEFGTAISLFQYRATSPRAAGACKSLASTFTDTTNISNDNAGLDITIEDSEEETHYHLTGVGNTRNHGNRPSNHFPSRLNSREKRKTQAEGITTWEDPEYEETAAAELSLTWYRVETMWIEFRRWRRQMEGTDPELDEALTRFKKIIRRLSDEAEHKEKIDPRDTFELDSM